MSLASRVGAASPPERVETLVIGAGPAGLMAADALSAAGRQTVVVDAMPSVARKFLMAGKSGLNITHAEPLDRFLPRYGRARARLDPILRNFGPDEIRAWAEGLGQDMFVGTTGRVFPKVMKTSPLLRAWLRRLAERGVEIRTQWRWTEGLGPMTFATASGHRTLQPDRCVISVGGASWRRLGSDGRWSGIVSEQGVGVAPFQRSNAGLNVAWSEPMARSFGAPVKGAAFHADDVVSRGEAVISARGLEGGGVYPLGPAIRAGAAVWIDLAPDLAFDEVVRRLAAPRGKSTLSRHIRRSLRLDVGRLALLNEMGRPLPEGAELGHLIKALPLRHQGLRPIDEALSTAGGLLWEELDERLMLRRFPGVFAAGEMIDWDAPTGGYLLTACLSTGRWAGRNAAGWT